MAYRIIYHPHPRRVTSQWKSTLTPADVYFGRGRTILLERERIKRETIRHRRLNHQAKAA